MPIDKEGNYFIYAIVANIIDKYYLGEEKKINRGVKQFRAGAKVYCIPTYGGSGHERIIVLGKARKSGRQITLVITCQRLKNWRVQKVYSPATIKGLVQHNFYSRPTMHHDLLLFNGIADEETKLQLLSEWAKTPADLQNWAKSFNALEGNMEINETDWKVLFSYRGEGGGGKVYQIPTGRVWLKHNEIGLEEEAILPVNIEKEFESWELFWQFFINKYPHWELLHPNFHEPNKL